MEIPFFIDAAKTSIVRRGVIITATEMDYSRKRRARATVSAQHHFTSADVSLSAQRDLLMELPYANAATTEHGPTGHNVASEEADNPRKRCAHLLEQYSSPLCRCRPIRDGTRSWRSRSPMLLRLALPNVA